VGWEDGRQPADERSFGERPPGPKGNDGTLGDGERPARGRSLRMGHDGRSTPVDPRTPHPARPPTTRSNPCERRTSSGPTRRAPKGGMAGARNPLKGVRSPGNRASPVHPDGAIRRLVRPCGGSHHVVGGHNTSRVPVTPGRCPVQTLPMYTGSCCCDSVSMRLPSGKWNSLALPGQRRPLPVLEHGPRSLRRLRAGRLCSPT
jgi:hypothetical protein